MKKIKKGPLPPPPPLEKFRKKFKDDWPEWPTNFSRLRDDRDDMGVNIKLLEPESMNDLLDRLPPGLRSELGKLQKEMGSFQAVYIKESGNGSN